MYEVLFKVRDQYKTRIYLAYLEGTGEPVACSSMRFIPGQPIVHMHGAATLEQYRGKGVYTSLLARRLADARGDGPRAAVIQAMRTTSAPVCRKLARIIHKPSTAVPYLPVLAASSSLSDPQRVFQTRLRSFQSSSLPSQAATAPRYEVCE